MNETQALALLIRPEASHAGETIRLENNDGSFPSETAHKIANPPFVVVAPSGAAGGVHAAIAPGNVVGDEDGQRPGSGNARDRSGYVAPDVHTPAPNPFRY